jgi:PadR family transcriptional regulator, regulatory protein PadR
MRLSPSRLKVIGQFLEGKATEFAGADLMRATGLASGSLYPILYSLEQAGVLESRWEEQEPATLGRPRRRLYRLTGAGEQAAREAAVEFEPLFRWARSVER